MARRGSWRATALALGLAAPLLAGLTPQAAARPGVPPAQPAPAAGGLPPQPGGAIQLKVRRQADAVELVVEGTGAGPQLQQSTSANGWLGQLVTSTPGGLRVGPQRLTIPELGLQSVSLEGSGTSYRLSVTPMQGVPLGRPVVSADGQNLIISFPASPQVSNTTARFDVNQPGRIPGQPAAPPLQPRAVAPPLGDMAVGTMTLKNRGFLALSGPPVTLTARGANPRDILMTLAQIGGYGFAYSEQPPQSLKQGTDRQPMPFENREKVFKVTPVTVAFRNERFERAFNFVLASSGLQARKEGNTLIVGPGVLQQSFGPQVSRVYRLNQASPDSAADYLANLGALVTKTFVEEITATTGVPLAGASTSNPQTTRTSKEIKVQQYGGEAGPLIGLRATTDSRLGTITVVGEGALVAVAEQYLRQLDLRQRQVALSVRILDVTLENNAEIDNSFSLRFGNTFIVNDSGRLLAAFGRNLPADAASFVGPAAQPRPNPGLAYPDQSFYDFLRSQILSSNTKILASPTLIIQEGGAPYDAFSADIDGTEISKDGKVGRERTNEALVRVGTQLVTSYEIRQDVNGVSFCQPVFSTAGLTFGAKVDKIDDNGFVSFSISPEISAAVGGQQVGSCGSISLINSRSLDTGQLRVRDGQTLILTGVISDTDRQVVTKWPVFGDLPLIGQFFRRTSGARTKNELVIMLTPRIIDESEGGGFGYGTRAKI